MYSLLDLIWWKRGGSVDTVRMALETPQPKRWRATDSEAVAWCREWMVFLGETDVVVTVGESHDVCDLYSKRFLGWVDNRRGNVGLELVERAGAIAARDGRRAVVFVSGGVLPEAQDRADQLGLALLRFDAQGGNLDGANRLGRQVRETGLAMT